MEQQPKIMNQETLDEALSMNARLELEDYAAVPGKPEKKIFSKTELAAYQRRDDIVTEALAEAEAIRERAKSLYLQVETKIHEATAKGFADGLEKGQVSVTELLIKIRSEQVALMESLEKESLKLVYEIAHKIIGEAFRSSEEALLGMIRQALSASMGNELTVLVNPEEYERIKGSQSQLMGNLHGSQILKLRPAEAVKVGSCVIESEMGTIEANLETQLLAIRNALGLNE